MRLLVYLGATLRHAIRSRLLFVLFIFSGAIDYVFLKVLRATTLQIQGEVSGLSSLDLVFSALLVQLFSGSLLAVVYGLWMIPYAHRGSRSGLTYVLPISRFSMVLSYSTTVLILLAVQMVIAVICLGGIVGWGFVFSSAFPYQKLVLSFLFQAVCFQFLSAMMAVGSLSFGQVVTFVLGSMIFVLLQITGGLLRIEMVQLMGAAMDGFETARRIYQWLPPIGEFLYQLKELFWSGSFGVQQWVTWGLWWVAAHALLTLRLGFPSLNSSEE